MAQLSILDLAVAPPHDHPLGRAFPFLPLHFPVPPVVRDRWKSFRGCLQTELRAALGGLGG